MDVCYTDVYFVIGAINQIVGTFYMTVDYVKIHGHLITYPFPNLEV